MHTSPTVPHLVVIAFESAIRANPASAGPIESITLCDGRHGTGVWPEFRGRPRPARTSAPLTAGHLGRNAAGHFPIRTTSAAGSPPPAAVGQRGPGAGRAPGKGPVSGRGDPGHWRPSGRRRRPGSVTYRCNVVSRGRAAPPRHRVPLPVRGAPPLRAGGWPSTSLPWPSRSGTHRGGFALFDAATGQHGQAVALLAWPCRAPDAPARADPGGKRRVRRAAEDRDLTHLRIPGFPAGTAAGPGAAGSAAG
jgi:hypothetical protein